MGEDEAWLEQGETEGDLERESGELIGAGGRDLGSILKVQLYPGTNRKILISFQMGDEGMIEEMARWLLQGSRRETILSWAKVVVLGFRAVGAFDSSVGGDGDRFD